MTQYEGVAIVEDYRHEPCGASDPDAHLVCARLCESRCPDCGFVCRRESIPAAGDVDLLIMQAALEGDAEALSVLTVQERRLLQSRGVLS